MRENTLVGKMPEKEYYLLYCSALKKKMSAKQLVFSDPNALSDT